MKITYIFSAILLCSVIGSLVGDRTAKTLFLVTSGALAIFGLARLL